MSDYKENQLKKIREFSIFLLEAFKTTILALAIVIPVRYFLFQPFVVSGSSMLPNFEDGNYLLVDEISPRFYNFKRGDVVVFKAPPNPSSRYIKRIIGLPGETVSIINGVIMISSQDRQDQTIIDESRYLQGVETSGHINISLKQDEYFVLGDNRMFSSDSRTWGILPKSYIIGRVFLRPLPLNEFTLIKAPFYNYSLVETPGT